MAGIKTLRLETLDLLSEIMDVLRIHIANVTFFNDTDVAARNLARLEVLTVRLRTVQTEIRAMANDG